MTKSKEEIKLNPKPAFYCFFLEDIKECCAKFGYALAVHGSLESDLDLIAVPWVGDCVNHEILIEKINDLFEKTMFKGYGFKDPGHKPHGRIAYTMSIESDWYIDLSVIDRKI